MKSTTPIILRVESEVVSIGRDSEFAHIGNPTGEIYRDIYFAVAELNDGELYRHDYHWQTEGHAQRFADKVQKAVNNGTELNEKHWYYSRCMYGSNAYIKNGRGDREMIEFEQRCEEEDSWR
jgi:hypothetical protein